jgi:hypothetical protein
MTPLCNIEVTLPRVLGSPGWAVAVLSMSKQEFSRLEVLLRVQSGRLRVGDACVLIGLQRRQVFRPLRGLKQDGKPGLGYGPLAPRKVDVVPDHHLHQFGKANPSLPAVNAARLGRIAAQRIDVSRRPLITAIYFDVLPVESNRRESELDEIAHVTEIDTRAATRRKVVIERQIFVSCRRMSASGRARRRLRHRRALSPPKRRAGGAEDCRAATARDPRAASRWREDPGTQIAVEEVPNSRIIVQRMSPRHGHGSVLPQDHVRGLLGDQIDR